MKQTTVMKMIIRCDYDSDDDDADKVQIITTGYWLIGWLVSWLTF